MMFIAIRVADGHKARPCKASRQSPLDKSITPITS